MNQKTASRPWLRTPLVRWLVSAALLIAAAAVVAACQPVMAPATGSAPAAEAAATEAAAPEATAAATEEPAAEATEAPAAEAADASADVVMVGDPARGGYIFAATTGCGCHFNRDLGGPAGGNKFEGPFGVVHVSNITSDPETGLGDWTDQQIVDALRLGKRPDGTMLFPGMPYHDWSVMADQDAYDLVAAMRQIPPIKNAVPKTELVNPIPEFVPAAPPPAVAPTEGVERGAYLAALGRCAGCHTPKTETGAPDTSKLFGGAPLQDTIAPNLTPDELNGIGAVSDEEIAHFLLTGMYEDGTEVDGPMAQVIKNGTSKLTETDISAIVAYLRSLPPVDNAPQ